MSKRSFTPRAELIWGSVPASARDQIVSNAFCRTCRGAVKMIDYTGTEKKGNLLLEGACAKCGHRVVRVVETSEAAPPNN